MPARNCMFCNKSVKPNEAYHQACFDGYMVWLQEQDDKISIVEHGAHMYQHMGTAEYVPDEGEDE